MTRLTQAEVEPSMTNGHAPEPPTLGRQSSIAALVPHYRAEPWLDHCLASLVQQTHPLQAIVVIDDASPEPPVEIVARYPTVTLLAASENVGPYRLLQQVIADTRYDGYLFQDADDWSSRERLAALLDEAERTGAELVGCQEAVVDCETAEVRTVRYPLDVNAELTVTPGLFALAHHASVVSRTLLTRICGFAGVRIGGDSELLQRAVHAAAVRNVAGYYYFRRQRAGSLTTDPATGFASAERQALAARLRLRAEADAAARARGEPVSLAPTVAAEPVRLTHVAGPALTGRTGRAPSPTRAARTPATRPSRTAARRRPARARRAAVR